MKQLLTSIKYQNTYLFNTAINTLESVCLQHLPSQRPVCPLRMPLSCVCVLTVKRKLCGGRIIFLESSVLFLLHDQGKLQTKDEEVYFMADSRVGPKE